MGWLSDARAAVVTVLTAEDLFTAEQVIDHNPERLVPPAAILTYGSPMLEDGETFGDYTLRMNVTLVPMTGTNETLTIDLETMIERAISGLVEAGYGVGQVGQPYNLQANNGIYLATDIVVVGLVRP